MESSISQPEGSTHAGPAIIYQSLAEHQQSEEWFAKDVSAFLRIWAVVFDIQFKLEIPELALKIDVLRNSCYGQFRYGHNGLGLKGEIGINARYLFGQLPEYEVLGTLLHEQLHGWQQAYGKPGKGNYHNKQFRDKALSLGLMVDEDGVQTYSPAPNPFFDLLSKRDISVPLIQATTPSFKVKLPGKSKLKKWTCPCGMNVRCARELHSVCLDCGEPFVRQDR